MLGVAICLSSTMAPAAGIYRTRDFRCSALQALVRSEGVFRVREGREVRSYVARTGLCPSEQEAIAAYEQASDRNFCFIGFQCSNKPQD